MARALGSGEVDVGIKCRAIGAMGTGATMLMASGVVGAESNLGERLSLRTGERVNLGGELVVTNEV